MTSFETTIQAYLENRAKTDSLFAETYKKANKSIEECVKYIYSKARKLAKGRNAVGVDEATVYGWAVHYYDEDDIKVNKVQERVEVVAPASEPAKAEQPKPQLKPQPKRKRGDDNSLQLSLFGGLLTPLFIFKEALATGTDLNTVKTAGIYRLTGSYPNAPFTQSWGCLIVLPISYGADYIQIAVESTSQYFEIYTRNDVSNSSSWKKIALSSV